jgi:hypothetical protein
MWVSGVRGSRSGCRLMSGDKNHIISLLVAGTAAFLIYGIKFLSNLNDKNFISEESTDNRWVAKDKVCTAVNRMNT